MYNYYTPQLGSLSSLVKKVGGIADPRNALYQAIRTAKTGQKITENAAKLAIDSTKRAVTNPTGIVDNVIADVKQAASVTAGALTKPITDEITNIKKDFYSGGAYQSAQRYAAEKAAAERAEKKREEEAMMKHMQEVREANAKNANEASKSAGIASASKAVENAYRIENADSQGTQQIRDSAAMAQNSAATSEQMQYLPEVQVKSDFSKYLLIGGGVLLLAYILKNGGKE